ncbi:MAG: hypothetical protein IKX24_03975 [Prevotella sp.]|nr:hypothetical protein [Prevotella sp.]
MKSYGAFLPTEIHFLHMSLVVPEKWCVFVIKITTVQTFAVSSATGVGAAIGAGYVVADYMLYRFTGKDIRQRLNNYFYEMQVDGHYWWK